MYEPELEAPMKTIRNQPEKSKKIVETCEISSVYRNVSESS